MSCRSLATPSKKKFSEEMSYKRSREASAAIVKDIRTTTSDDRREDVEKRTRYIKQQLDNMSEEQLTRFEFFVRSHLPRGKVREILANALGPKYTVTDEMAIVVCGLAKLFVGEITEIAGDVVKESGATDGIKVAHLEEAYRRLQNEGKINKLPDRAYLFSPHNLATAEGSAEELFGDATSLDELIAPVVEEP